MHIVLEHAGAERGTLLLETDGKLTIEAQIDDDEIEVLAGRPLAESSAVWAPIVQLVARTQEDVVLDDARKDDTFGENPYVTARQLRSVLCMAIRHKGVMIGVLYLENNQATGVFTPQRCALLQVLSSQASISIENARLVSNLEALVNVRTRELQETNEVLRESNQELDSFSHMVAHDLKNQVNVVTGYSSLLQEAWQETPVEEVDLMLEAVQKTGFRMTAIIEGLLQLANVRRGEFTPLALDMGEIVAEVLDGLRPMIKEQNATLSTPSSWPAAVGHPQWIAEVWTNYVSNGLKYGGSPPILELGADLLPDGRAQFWVKDNGAGLSPEAQKKMFTPFTRLERDRAEGHGLGLSIVQRIVEKLGGEVGVETAVGEGSRFFFVLRTPSMQEGGGASP